ncbi:Chromodomain-helicase-DNA-binding protein 1 [Plasmodiophora brassicae]
MAGRFSLADYEPRRSERRAVPVARYGDGDDEDGDGSSDDRPMRPGSAKRRVTQRPRGKRRAVLSDSDDSDSLASSSSNEEDFDEQMSDIDASDSDQSRESDDDGDDEVIVQKRRPASRRRASSAKTKYVESDDDDAASHSDDDDVDRSSRKVEQGPQFEETGEPAIEKVVDWRQDDDGEREYEVKWKFRSYIHTSWHTYDELMNVKGFRIAKNFLKFVEAHEAVLSSGSAEQREQSNIAQEMARQKRKRYEVPERILTSRVDPSTTATQYLVKWTDLGYDECTWENVDDLVDFQNLIDSYLERSRSQSHKVSRNASSKSRFEKLETQPEWMSSAGTLRDYQLEGLNWMLFSHFERRNVILADEMGLGKTIQCISFLGCLHADHGIPGPYLVVVPLSTIAAWKREFSKWTPWMNVVEYRGTKDARAVCRDYEWYGENTAGGSSRKPAPAFNVLLTNYEVANKDFEYLNQFTWAYLLIDEAHRLKDDQSLLYQTLKSLRSTHRLLITGTPLQNSVKELWCLLHFLDPHKFCSLPEFESTYGGLTESVATVTHLSKLHDLLKPYLLRRTKSDVLKSLPSKTERILRVDMSDMQKRYYRWVLTKNFNELNKGLRGNSVSSLSNTIMELKKVANHPYLFENAELKNHESTLQELTRMVANSGKMVLLDRLLDRLFETGHRVLIFSQMVRMLDILADYLVLKGFKFQRLDGSMRSEDRQHAMDHFNADGSPDFVFLLSTRAGGLGVNLATADTVIIFDSDWNPQNDLQAEARAHRIGQTKTVNIYRFVMKSSVEEDILERAKRKMVLDHLVIQKMDTSGRGALTDKAASKGERKQTSRAQFDKEELLRIVQFGAKQLFEESENITLSDDAAANPASATTSFDLDEILARAETTDTDGQDVNQTEEFLSAFKVANFASEASGASVVVKANVPDDEKSGTVKFWEKVIPAHLRPAAPSDLPEEPIYPRRARLGKAFLDDDQKDGALNGRSTKGKKRDTQRIVRQAVRALMQFGDRERAAAVLPGGAEENGKILDELLEMSADAKEAITYHGVDVDAPQLHQRVLDMAILKRHVDAVDKPYERFRMTAPIPSVRWKCAWGVRHDSMLLLGAHLYGVGAWAEICEDPKLGIGEVVLKEPRVVLNSHLSSRLQSLLRAMRTQDDKRARTTTSSAPKLPPAKKAKKNHVRVDSHSNASAVDVKKRALPTAATTTDLPIKIDPKVTDWCMAELKSSQIGIIKTLKKLKTIDLGQGIMSDPRPVIKYLFRVGDAIVQTGNENRCPLAPAHVVEHHLWHLAAPFLRTTASTLSSLYWDLAAEPNVHTRQTQLLSQFAASRSRPSS